MRIFDQLEGSTFIVALMAFAALRIFAAFGSALTVPMTEAANA